MSKIKMISFIIKSALKGRLWLKDFVIRERVLDIGCGKGDFLDGLEGFGVGIDINEEVLRIAYKKGLKIVGGSGVRLPFKDEAFSVVMCMNMIEHLYTEQAYEMVVDACRVLKKNGIFIVKTELVTRKFWETFSHTRPYPPKSFVKITNENAQETFAKLRSLEIISIVYEGNYYKNKILTGILNLLAQFIPLFRRSYIMILKKRN